MGVALAVSYRSAGKTQQNAAQILWWIAFAGALFSIYLTYLEPFVIGATCAWCLVVSAISVTTILWGSAPLVVDQRKKTNKRKATRRAQTGPIR
jgi:uncharacterized membrane protein